MCLGNTRFPRAVPLAAPTFSTDPMQLQLKASPKTMGSVGTFAQPMQKQLNQREVVSVEDFESSATAAVAAPPACHTRSHDHDRYQPEMAAKKSTSITTTKQHVTVQHNYHDHACDSPSAYRMDLPARGGVTTPFPIKLFRMLSAIDGTVDRDNCRSEDGQENAEMEEDVSHIISWQPHGRCFVVHKPKEFTAQVLPKFMGLNKLASFQRQLNLYGFQRLTRGRDRGAYYHELFLRGKFYLAHAIGRSKVKGTGVRGRSNPDQEPEFWRMPWVNAKDPSHEHDCDKEESMKKDAPATDPEVASPADPPPAALPTMARSIVSQSSSCSVHSDDTTAGSSIASDASLRISSVFAPPGQKKKAPTHPPKDIVFSLDIIQEHDEPMPPVVVTPPSVMSIETDDDDSLSCCLVFDDQDDKAIFQYFLDEEGEEEDAPMLQPEVNSSNNQVAIQFGKTFFDTATTSFDYKDSMAMEANELSPEDWATAMEQLQHW